MINGKQKRFFPILKKITSALLATTSLAATVAFADPTTKIDPQQIYQQKCSVCHMSGVAGAPKFGDKAAWQAKLAATGESDPTKQLAAVVKIAIQGKGAMPAKGMCMECSEADLQAVTQYMIDGGKK